MNTTTLAPWTEYHPQQKPRSWLIAFLIRKNLNKTRRSVNAPRRSAEIAMDQTSWEQLLMLATNYIETGQWIIGRIPTGV